MPDICSSQDWAPVSSQESKIPPRSPTWIAGYQVLDQPSAVSKEALAITKVEELRLTPPPQAEIWVSELVLYLVCHSMHLYCFFFVFASLLAHCGRQKLIINTTELNNLVTCNCAKPNW